MNRLQLRRKPSAARTLAALAICGLALAPTRSFSDDKPAVAEKHSAEKEKSSAIFAEIKLTGSYTEGPQTPGLFGSLTENLRDALKRIEKAKDDERIGGIILKFDDPTELHLNWAKAHEFRQAIKQVRDAGKPVYAWMTMPDAPSYLVAAACDKVFMPESGTIMLLGLRAEVTFYKNLFDKLDIDPEMLRVGEFKSAAEPYTRTEMSPEFRKEMEELLDDLYGQMITVVAEGRGLTEEAVTNAVDNGPHTAEGAKKAGLIDGFAYEDEIKTRIAETQDLKEAKIARNYSKKKLDTDFSGLQGFIALMDLLSGVEPGQSTTAGSKIALVYATGAIMPGESQNGLLGGEVLGSETLIKAIDKAAGDDDVKAIVLRVDSPGGSALASDLIWRSVKLAKEKKPVVVSMGSVAASGGYYISMAADSIVAEPNTITGSIGVVGGKLGFKGLLNKIGVTTSVVSRGKNSGALSILEGFSDSEREAMQRMMNDIYAQFTSKAAAGRNMEVEKLEKLARGRIYSGTRAKDLGLVDETGTLSDAMEIAKQIAQKRDLLDEGEEPGIMILPKPKSPLEELFGPLDGDASTRATLNAAASLNPDLADKLSGLGIINRLSSEGVMTLMPFQVDIR